MQKIIITFICILCYFVLLFPVIVNIKEHFKSYKENINKNEKKSLILNVLIGSFSIIVIAMFLIAFLLKNN